MVAICILIGKDRLFLKEQVVVIILRMKLEEFLIMNYILMER